MEKHETLQHLILTHLSSYYSERDRDSQLKLNPKTHYHKANRVHESYQKELTEQYPEWATKEAKEAVKKMIDYLTGIFTKHEEAEGRKERLQNAPKEIEPEIKRSRIIIW